MSKKILVCDDDQGILEVIKIVLEKEGFEVKLLANGRGIQKIIKDYKPDLILLDIWMPGVDGEEITKILKKTEETSKIPIVVISALNTTEKIAQESGADDFLEKPFDISDLVKIVKKYT